MSKFFELDRVKSADEVKIGMVLYLTSPSGYIYKLTVQSEPEIRFICEGTVALGPFISVRKELPEEMRIGIKVVESTRISLRDAGVIDNPYNNWKLFYTRESAEAYADNAKIHKLTFVRS